jgi:hypothetical protein
VDGLGAGCAGRSRWSSKRAGALTKTDT